MSASDGRVETPAGGSDAADAGEASRGAGRGPLSAGVEGADVGAGRGASSAREDGAEALRSVVAPPSVAVRDRVTEARERQRRRLAGTGARCNADMDAPILRERAAAAPEAVDLLLELHDRHGLSARGHDRVLRVARTLADLAASRRVRPEHVRAAIGLRTDDMGEGAAA